MAAFCVGSTLVATVGRFRLHLVATPTPYAAWVTASGSWQITVALA